MTNEDAIKEIKKEQEFCDFESKTSEAFDMAISALKESKSRWIPVSERLPEENHAVLVWCPERKNIYCAYIEEKQWWIFGAYFQKVTLDVIAWMPLPQPYVPDTNDGKIGESEEEGTENVVDCRTIPCAYRRYGPMFLLPGAPQKCVDCLNEMYGMEEGE